MRHPNVCVFAPAVLLSIIVEPLGNADGAIDGDVHLHPGGQGFWIARMLAELGERPVLCGPVGGESGRAIEALMEAWGVPFQGAHIEAESPCLIQDRRSGRRVDWAQGPVPRLDRHELDDLYGTVLQLALETRTCVVTGLRQGLDVPLSFYHRLAADLAPTDVVTVGDLHGPELDAWLSGGPLGVLKVSDEDLDHNGWTCSEATIPDILASLVARGAGAVVLSEGEHGACAMIGGELWRARPLPLSVVDAAGAGDAMTAGLTAGTLRGLDPGDLLRLACAAGSTSVARHGLATGSVGLVRQLFDEVDVERWEAS